MAVVKWRMLWEGCSFAHHLPALNNGVDVDVVHIDSIVSVTVPKMFSILKQVNFELLGQSLKF